MIKDSISSYKILQINYSNPFSKNISIASLLLYMVDVMAFVVFIGGLLEYNSGKTTVAKEIILNLEQKQSLSTIPFKPLSGNNLFYHYKQIKENVTKFNQFISLDIVDLLSNSSSKMSPTITNPVHRVSTEALSYEFFKESSIKTFYSKYSSSVTLFQRFSIFDSTNGEKPIFIVNEPIYKNQKFWNDLSLTDPIIKQAQDVRPFKNEHEYYSLNNQFYAEATKTAFEILMKDAQALVIESFNNSAHPAWCIRDSNVIVLVGPGSLFVYEPETYFRAIDNYRSINRNKPTTTDDILNFATPTEAYSISIDEKEKSKEISAICQTLYDNYK